MKIKIISSFIIGMIIGLAAGIIGVGGGEFRIPALTYLMGGSMNVIITSNLIIGFFTVLLSFFLRLLYGLAGETSILYGFYLSIGSMFGACVGAIITSRVSDKNLKLIIGIYLTAIGIKFIFEPVLGEVGPNLIFQENLVPFYLCLFGFLVGMISSMFGVAGGEIRIPILVMLFGLGIKIAGTVSLLASIATVGTGLMKHLQMGHFEKKYIWITLPMTIGSALGVFVGTSLAVVMYEEHLKKILGIIVILATIRFFMKNSK
ncbi:MAG: sulfite exporter TauE/SafE family protein [Nitrososphaerales archaeon]